MTSGTGTVSHYGEQTLGTLRLNARADSIGAEYIIYIGDFCFWARKKVVLFALVEQKMI
jgi:hypothetical protein